MKSHLENNMGTRGAWPRFRTAHASIRTRDTVKHKPVLAAATALAVGRSETSALNVYERDGTATASTSGIPVHIFGDSVVKAASPEHWKPQDPHDEQLYEEIRSCEYWQDVMDIIMDEGSTMSTKRSVQALTKLSNLTKSMSAAERSALIEQDSSFSVFIMLIYSRITGMKQSQASSTSASLVALKVKVPEEAVSHLSQALLSNATLLSSRDLSSAMSWLATLGAKPQVDLLNKVALRAVQLLQPDSTPSLHEASKGSVMSHGNTQVDKDQVADSSRTVAEVSATSSTFLHVLKSHSESRKDEFSPQSLSMLMRACVAFKFKHPHLTRAAVNWASSRLSQFSPQGVSNLIWATAKLEFYAPAFIKAALTFFAEHSSAFKPQEIGNFMWALTHLRHHPQESARLLLSVMLEQQGAGLKAADVVSCLTMLATFGIYPGKLIAGRLTAWLEAISPEGCSTAELSSTMWALALLGETRRPAFLTVANSLPARFEKGEMDEGLLRQSFQAVLCAKLADLARREEAALAPSTSKAAAAAAQYSAVPTFPAPMLEAMKQSWVSSMKQGAVQAVKEGSPTRVVSELASTVRVQHDAARPTKDGLALIDIAIRPNEERYVALQVLREYDCTRNTGQMLGSLQFERQILEKNGWEVKYLKYTDLLLVGDKERPFFMAEFLRSLGCTAVKNVLAPGESRLPASAQASRLGGFRRRSAGVDEVSEEAREAGLVLNDPKADKRASGSRGFRPRI
ncbi:hypothetical protein CEUSTIGMA_g6378.t1 [Chlamydomonas eustigma]|uniref:RAP domain-containing protein n=1 Tax=Chlamydomonas eustigma TaxID=1157962 RepID=A0A250X781_9CHLO|nr:hypothetical protein CEUSTIGMA_g6378.t1 [Chlamydomonas eustigma]|eukprot:GAX78938.1 hypothetical protein CEUSTIGMA_g6378.t1 [Chlamydomonas eustigma]